MIIKPSFKTGNFCKPKQLEYKEIRLFQCICWVSRCSTQPTALIFRWKYISSLRLCVIGQGLQYPNNTKCSNIQVPHRLRDRAGKSRSLIQAGRIAKPDATGSFRWFASFTKHAMTLMVKDEKVTKSFSSKQASKQINYPHYFQQFATACQ